MIPSSSLRGQVITPIKQRFVGRDEIVDLIALTVVAGEHLFLHGPPGTAKSALIRTFARAVQGSYFEYMLTRFTEPNEIFGPIDIAKLRDGKVVTVTTGMLPEAEFAFLDELFNANRRDPQQPAHDPERANLSAWAGDASFAAPVAVLRVEPFARGTARSRPCSIASCCVAMWTTSNAMPCPGCCRRAGSWSKVRCRVRR